MKNNFPVYSAIIKGKPMKNKLIIVFWPKNSNTNSSSSAKLSPHLRHRLKPIWKAIRYSSTTLDHYVFVCGFAIQAPQKYFCLSTKKLRYLSCQIFDQGVRYIMGILFVSVCVLACVCMRFVWGVRSWKSNTFCYPFFHFYPFL